MIQDFTQHKAVLGMFGLETQRSIRVFSPVLGVVLALMLVGCGGDQPRDESDTGYYTDRSSVVFSPEPPASASPIEGESVGGQRVGLWTILLVRVQRADAQVAGRMLQVVVNDAGLDGAFLDHRTDGTIIAYGRYPDKSDPRAIKDLERIRSLKVGGEQIFAQAILIPPSSEELRGANEAYDLRNVKAKFGDRAIYTLQIGVYGRADFQPSSAQELAEYRHAAEQAVRELRADGVMAFYYHAPNRSMVTVGVFTEQDFDASTMPPTESLALRNLKEQFPHNLLNGKGIEETVRTASGKKTRLQESRLVGIPEK
ncbi:MAG: hypothetical protein ACWA5W_08965 [Phycisphaerales bacterium]